MYRYSPIIFLLYFLFSTCSQSNPAKKNSGQGIDTISITKYEPDSDFIFNSLNPSYLLPKLVNSTRIDTAGAVLWKPTMYERQSVMVSADGLCHTNVDTTMYFKNSRNDSCAVVILTSYVYDYSNNSSKMEITGCHFCGVPIGAALFKRVKNRWKLYNIKLQVGYLGNWGQYRFPGRGMNGTISLIPMDNNFTCLSLKSGLSGNSGVIEGYESLFWIDDYAPYGGMVADDYVLKNMFQYTYYVEEDLGYLGGGYRKILANVIFINQTNNYPLLLLTEKDKGKKQTKLYEYSTDFGCYIEKK